MSEYKVNHLVVELTQLLGSNAAPEDFIKLLSNNTSSNQNGIFSRVSQSHLQEIAKTSPNPELFIQKFEELQTKNVDSLGSFVELLYHISKDPNTKQMLKKAKGKPTVQLSGKVIEVTPANLAQIKNCLLKAVTDQKITSTEIPNDNIKSTSPLLIERRPSMSWDFNVDNIGMATLGVVPIASQEGILIEDLLNAFQGIEGCYIDPVPLSDTFGERLFNISTSVDPALHDLVQQMLPLASNYSIVQRFIEQKVRFEDGQVNHALSSAMAELLKDYYIFICQLEAEHRSGNLTLQKIWFYIQRNMQSMSTMANIAATIGKADAKGGKVLSLLHEQTVSSIANDKTRELCLFLTQRAAVPYMEMLGTWIYTGIINDPFKEFLVEDNEKLGLEEEPMTYSDSYWEKRYSIRRDRLPVFLERMADVVLRAGKYLNVVRQCGKPIVSKAEDLVYSIKEQCYVEQIENAYLSASKMLQELLMKENDLVARLRSVKHYFLLDQGDFIVHFMDLCEEELSKDVNDVLMPRLESLFELALRLSVSNNDLYKDDMRITLLPYDLQNQMSKILTIHTDHRTSDQKISLTGLQSFSFAYEVKWPVSLVLNHKAIACYQMIFRHLFFCKYVERLICRVWMCNKKAKKFGHSEAEQYRAAFTLRQRMLNCVQNLEYHMMVEVIEPNWQLFKENIAKVKNVDDILKCHSSFLDNCLADCMLTSPSLLYTVTKLLNVCVEFCNFLQSPDLGSDLTMMDSTTSIGGSTMSGGGLPVEESSILNGAESFEQRISRFDMQFTTVVVGLMDKINDISKKDVNNKLVNLLYRFDFNSFYSTYRIKLHDQIDQKSDHNSMKFVV